MRLNYFGYYFENNNINQRYLFDLRSFIRTFSSLENVSFKNSFLYNDEHLYLFPAAQNIYLFVMTRSNEIIKRINTNDLHVNEIYELLEQGEQLGFASYVYFQEKYLGFASTILAPKVTALIHLINSILEKIGQGNLKFVAQALLHQASRNEVLNLPFIGRTIIEVSKENSFAEDIKNFVGASADDVGEIESFELIIKPKRRKNIEPLVKKFIRNIPEDGVEKLIIKAKDELQDHLTDLYLVGKGAISDYINTRDENAIYEHIVTKTENNMLLKQKINEFANDERFTETGLENIRRFNDAATWTDFIHNI